ncbi:YbhB/YbcL family Raf kinase inhibitor-like protein [Pseudarthrobacter sp. RMG13]|uniref:YbhB/YbcL family Raf kinase inhibitor-like protein n=1 Tax=Pseudarthrobacter humi TaxID=2952523 RepID=A0ABT1LSR1_9MICC|nr:YbhB/YbcL family Raf kinase inhibitor-like protein [Pseudarthrobacter humi]MCP9001494.1 YbhB/YbcL family Raf kinase inhibitor-like protein [Pseudarthrobacter humi]
MSPHDSHTRHGSPFLHLSSESIQDGQTLPPAQRSGKMRAGGRDESPQLSWGGAPAGTMSYAVTTFDPDAPGSGGFWHWAMLDIPAGVTSLPAGAGAEGVRQLPSGAIQLKNDAGFHGYVGAAPPPGHGPHRYVFTVYALDVEHLGLDAGFSPAKLESKLSAHSLGRGMITAIFER